MQTQTVPVSDPYGSYSLTVAADDHIGKEIFRTGRPYEYRLLRLTAPLISPGDLVVDVGANIGNHALSYSRHGCRVLALEPNPDAFAILRQNVCLNSGDIDPRNVAVSRQVGRGSVRVRIPGNLGSAAVNVDAEGQVEVTTVDRLNVRAPRLMKIDVEGAELAVLEGSVETLRRWHPAIVVELQSREVKQAVKQFLSTLGYSWLPVSLSGEPTFLFSVARRDLARVARQPLFWAHAVRRGGSRVRHMRTRS